MSVQVHAFDFSRLPQIERTWIAANNQLLKAFPASRTRSERLERIENALSRMTHQEVKVSFVDHVSLSKKRLSQHFQERSCWVRVRLSEDGAEGLLDCDIALAHRIASALRLSRERHRGDLKSELSLLDLSLLQVPCLEIIRHLRHQEFSGNSLNLHFLDIGNTLQSINMGSDSASQDWIGLGFRVLFDEHVFALRIWLPERSLVHFKGREQNTASLNQVRERYQENSKLLEAIHVDTMVNVGELTLSRRDVSSIERGDIVLLDDPKLDLSPLSFVAEADVYFKGSGKTLARGIVRADGSGATFEFQSFEALNTPLAQSLNEQEQWGSTPDASLEEEYEMSDEVSNAMSEHSSELNSFSEDAVGKDIEGSGEESAENYEEGPAPLNGDAVALLGNLPVTMRVEVGRLRMRSDELLTLQSGYVLALERTKDDPVDLVVDGTRIGSGELVDIEGEIGVRILEILR